MILYDCMCMMTEKEPLITIPYYVTDSRGLYIICVIRVELRLCQIKAWNAAFHHDSKSEWATIYYPHLES